MVENLIEFLQAYKSEMEFKNVHFDSNCPAQYSWLRQKITKLYKEDTSLFGPVSLAPVNGPLSSTSKEEKDVYGKQNKTKNYLIRKGYSQIREKVKEIRQSFSQAVINGKRSGSGKIVYEFYDKLITIWGGSAATKPLLFGAETDAFSVEEQSAWVHIDPDEPPSHDDSISTVQ